MTMNLFVLLFCVFIPVYDFYLLVETNDGEMMGTTYNLPNGRVLEVFYGIPYADPPIGENRFEPPQRKKSWDGIWDATYSRSACEQFFFMEGSDRLLGDEDCLYLNLFRPQELKESENENKLLNVMVYIPGGAFMFGSGKDIYPDDILQDADIIFVVICYRVGPLGFLSTENLIAPGNNGLKDQVAALQWVQRNINYFGGDPKKVTIYGPSAGAACVHYHLLSPLSKGLFSKAISASGSVLPPWTLIHDVKKNSRKLAFELNCLRGDVSLMMTCLKEKTAEEIFQATKRISSSSSKSQHFISELFSPVIELKSPSAFLSENPLNLLKKGKVEQIPWMVSFVEKEGTAAGLGIFDDEKMLKELNDKWNENAPYLFSYDNINSNSEKDNISSAVREYYFKDKPISKKTENEMLQAIGDRLFNTRMTEAAKLHAAAVHKNTLYCYKLYFRGTESMCDRLSNKKRNFACHMDDQFYLVRFTGLTSNKSYMDVEMSQFLRKSIIAFMKTGNPNTGVVNWKPIDKGSGMNCLNIYSPTFQRMEDIEDEKSIRFWSDYLPSEHKESHK